MMLCGFDMKTVIQLSGWNPFQTYLLTACFLAGTAGLFSPGETSILARTVASWILHVWYTGLVVGSVIAFIGSHFKIRDRITIEVIGLSILGFVTFGYTTALVVVTGRPFSFSILSISFFFLSCIARCAQLIRKLLQISRGEEVSL